MKEKFTTAAHAIAMAAPGVGANGKFRLGAILVYKNTVVSVGMNSYKTHPLMATRTSWPFLHAEQHAIIRAGLDNCEDLDLYIARVRKNNDLAMSKPCGVCMKLIQDVSIKNVYYSTNKEKFVKAPTPQNWAKFI